MGHIVVSLVVDILGALVTLQVDGDILLTWRHVEGGAAAEFGCDGFGSGQSKITELDVPTMVRDQDVLRLQIPMVDADGMTKGDSVQDLKESMLCQVIVANEAVPLGNVGEQVAIWAVLDHHECAVRTVQDFHQLEHIGVLARVVMQLDFPSLEFALTMIQANLGQGFDSIGPPSGDVDGGVDHAISTNPEDGGEFQSPCQQTAQSVLRSKASN